MNLSKFLPGLTDTAVTDDEWEALSDEERAEVIAAEEKEFRAAVTPKRGPGTGVSFRTNGQVRRQRIRDAKRSKRKGQKAYNRSWMADQQRKANVRGQVQVMTDPKFNGTPMKANIERGMHRAYEARVKELTDTGVSREDAEAQVEKSLIGGLA